MEAHGPERGEPIRHASFLLLGGGLAAATAAEALRLEGAQGAIVIVADEPDPPYHRPQLSTRFLEGDSAPPLATVLAPDYFHDDSVSLLHRARAGGGVCAQGDRRDRAGAPWHPVRQAARPRHQRLPASAVCGARGRGAG